MFPKYPLDRLRLGGVVVRGRRAMSVNIIHLPRLNPSTAQRQAHASCCPFPIRRGGSDVISITIGPVANDLSIDLGPSAPGLLQFL